MKNIEDIQIEEFEKKLNKTELAHLVYFLADNKRVETFLEHHQDLRCDVCVRTLKKLDVISQNTKSEYDRRLR